MQTVNETVMVGLWPVRSDTDC